MKRNCNMSSKQMIVFWYCHWRWKEHFNVIQHTMTSQHHPLCLSHHLLLYNTLWRLNITPCVCIIIFCYTTHYDVSTSITKRGWDRDNLCLIISLLYNTPWRLNTSHCLCLIISLLYNTLWRLNTSHCLCLIISLLFCTGCIFCWNNAICHIIYIIILLRWSITQIQKTQCLYR